MLEHNGEEKSISEWAKDIGVNKNTIVYRLRRGWSVDRALQKNPKTVREIRMANREMECPQCGNTFIPRLSQLKNGGDPCCSHKCASSRNYYEKGIRPPGRKKTARQRFENKYEIVSESGCWVWIAGINDKGYGRFKLDGKLFLAHRAAYTIYVGEIPQGINVCHKCDVPECVNPDHLFLGTQKDNIQDSKSKGRHRQLRKTHCPNGHEYNEENTYFSSKGWRYCRACRSKMRII